MAATMAAVMATGKTKTGEDNDDDSWGRRRQQVTTATTTGKNNDISKEGNSEDYGNDGKDDRQGW